MSAVSSIQSSGVLHQVVNAGKNNSETSLEKESTALSDRFERGESVQIDTYNAKGKKKDLKELEGAEFHKEVALKKAEIKENILKKTKELLYQGISENPEWAEDIKNGKVPDHFNEANTAKRILDIYFSHYTEDQDREQFVKRASSIINQAYGDVTEINGGDLPGLVKDTRSLIFEKLEAFKNGASIQDIYDSLLNPKTDETPEAD